MQQSRILAIIDLDTNRERGHAENIMIVNNSERSRIAREHADNFSGKAQTNEFFKKMFDPDLVKLDVIEDRAKELIERIGERSAIVYLTSRPHYMRLDTEKWLDEHGITHPCFFKNYGTGIIGPDGKPDNGDRFIKTYTWKAQEVTRITQEIEAKLGEPPEYILFVDDEEANRAAVAEIGDPRILIRCSLEDATTHDLHRHETSIDDPPFLRRVRELANILEMREEFESLDKCQLTITRPDIPGQPQEQHISVMIESFRVAAFAPLDAGDDPNMRYYGYNEIYPQRNEMSEIEQIVSMRVYCDQNGQIIFVKTAKTGPALSLLNQLEEVFDIREEQEKAQKYADEWVAHAIEEFGYVEVARAQRGMQLLGKPALDAYMAHIQQKNEEIKAALRGGGKTDE